jgi:hypothetical protein
VESYSPLLPLLEFGRDIFGHEYGMFTTADELVFLGLAFGSHERKNRIAIGRGDSDPPSSGFVALVDDQAEAELIHIKTQALVLIADKNVNAKNAKVGILSTFAEGCPWR